MIICAIFLNDLHFTQIANYKFKMAAYLAKTTKSRSADNLILKGGTHSYSKIMVCKNPQGGGGFRFLAHGLL